MSSRDLNWKDFLVDQHRREPLDELLESVSERYILELWTGNGLGNHCDDRGAYEPYTKPAGSITCVCPGVAPPVGPLVQSEFVVSSLECEFVNGIEVEMEQRPFEKPRYQTGVHNPVLRRLVTPLAYEPKQSGPSRRSRSSLIACGKT